MLRRSIARIEATDVGSWSFVGSKEPVRNECKMIYEIFYILNGTFNSLFSRHGIPEMVCFDNGPQYDAAEFAKFAKDWEFKHVTTSRLHAQSNGEAE